MKPKALFDTICKMFFKRNVFYLVAIFSFCFNQLNAQSQKPNIILILADDIGYQTPNVNGGKSYATPNLNAMAAEGMNFTQCQASPTCSPSRFMLITGKYNFRNYTQWAVMDQGQKTVANMLKDAGYKTACYGKWQFDGGAPSVDTFGFDKYCLFNVSEQTPENKGARYKSPYLFTNGKYIPDSLTANRYSEDIIGDSISGFMESNRSRPFFIYYPMILAHSPFQPTPEDSAYAAWDSPFKSDTTYYSSMIKYMDEKVGAIMQKVKSLGIENNTVIMYVGDNGTPNEISQYVNDDSLIQGGKGNTTEQGTHVPLMIWWPGTISAGSVNNDLIGFTDFLPTFAGIANIPVPTNYGPLDGVSFYPRLTNNAGTPRDWLFYDYNPRPGSSILKRWAQTTTYKLYDTSGNKTTQLFYNISKDPKEKSPIPDNKLTPEEMQIKQELLDVINGYVAQAMPIFSKPFLTNITDTSVTIHDTILVDGGSSILNSGVVWGVNPDPVISSSSHTSGNKSLGAITTLVDGLTPMKTYYIRVYAINAYDTIYGSSLQFSTLLPAPVSTNATYIDSIGFTANWTPVAGATSYGLDVSAYSKFSKNTVSTLSEEFSGGMIPPAGWTFSSNIVANDTTFGNKSPSVQFNASKSQIVTKRFDGSATELNFWISGLNTNKTSSLLVEGFDGSKWTTIEKIQNLPSTGTAETYNATSKVALMPGFTQFRFTYTESQGTLAFDDVNITYNKTVSSFADGYNNLNVAGTTANIKGLTAGTKYYYRVRAKANNDSSGNSNVISLKTCANPSINSIDAMNVSCGGSNDGSINVNASGDSLMYNWTGPQGFKSKNKNISNLKPGNYDLAITSTGTCSVDSIIEVTEPSKIKISLHSDPMACIGGTTRLYVDATGGNGDFVYSLSGGGHNVGPQDSSVFTIGSGNYVATAEDKNHCSSVSDTIIVKDGKDNCGKMLVKISPNPANSEFSLMIETTTYEPLHLVVTDLVGNIVYKASGNSNGTYVFGNNFAPGIYFVHVLKGADKETLKVIKLNK